MPARGDERVDFSIVALQIINARHPVLGGGLNRSALGDHNDDWAALARTADRAGQRLVAFRIQTTVIAAPFPRPMAPAHTSRSSTAKSNRLTSALVCIPDANRTMRQFRKGPQPASCSAAIIVAI